MFNGECLEFKQIRFGILSAERHPLIDEQQGCLLALFSPFSLLALQPCSLLALQPCSLLALLALQPFSPFSPFGPFVPFQPFWRKAHEIPRQGFTSTTGGKRAQRVLPPDPTTHTSLPRSGQYTDTDTRHLTNIIYNLYNTSDYACRSDIYHSQL